MADAQPLGPYWIVGLGNPGPRYARTRHNCGFLVVDRLVDRWAAGPATEACWSRVFKARLSDGPLHLVQPQTFMNRSGESVACLLTRFGIEPQQLVVVHDDLDLDFGRIRIRSGGGHGGHNGLRSILSVLGTGEFVRLKIGIGRPAAASDVTEHVLGFFTADEEEQLVSLLDRASDAVEHMVREGPLRAMNRFNT